MIVKLQDLMLGLAAAEWPLEERKRIPVEALQEPAYVEVESLFLNRLQNRLAEAM